MSQYVHPIAIAANNTKEPTNIDDIDLLHDIAETNALAKEKRDMYRSNMVHKEQDNIARTKDTVKDPPQASNKNEKRNKKRHLRAKLLKDKEMRHQRQADDAFLRETHSARYLMPCSEQISTETEATDKSPRRKKISNKVTSCDPIAANLQLGLWEAKLSRT